MTCPSINQAMFEKNKHFRFYFSWRTSRYAARSGTPSFRMGKMPQLQASGVEKFFLKICMRGKIVSRSFDNNAGFTRREFGKRTFALAWTREEKIPARWEGKKKEKRKIETKKERSKREE